VVETSAPAVAPPADEELTPTVAPAPVEPPPTFAKERILLLAPQNPLVIELQLTIDGAPHTAALARLVGEVLKLADPDGDARVTWKELCANPRIKYGQFGNLAVEGDNSEKQIIERYDIDRDGIVDDTELPRFLTRNAGGSRPFSIRGTADYRGTNRRHAPTWESIDADGNGEISPEERAAAADRLAARDGNDDEILLPSELNPRALTLDPEMRNEARRRGPDAARLLGPHADWSSVALSLETEYGGSSILREGCFPLTPELFAQLDADKDGRLGRSEFAALNEIPPHLVVAVEFGRPPSRESEVGGQESEGEANTADEAKEEKKEEKEDEPAPENPPKAEPKVRVVSAAPALAGASPLVTEQSGRLTIAIGGVLLTIYTNDTVASEDFAARAKQALAMYDNNKDGYLVKEEVPENLQAQFGRFEAIDGDADEKAFPAEIEAFLTQQQAGLRAQIHAKASDREDVLFAALDADRDERLDSREVEAAAQRLGALDKNSDGLVTGDELPELMVIGLARGSLENADATFTPPPVVVRGPAGDAPRWFTAMDANSDGAISRREFLGTAEKFAELDADANGLLELAEAMKP
jgi:Ca2+-binding EF-hand superfamily protein